MRRIGVMTGLAATDPPMRVRLSAFGQELRKLGWDDGRNVQIDYRDISGSAEQALAAAKELLSFAPDVILAHSTTTVATLRRAGNTTQTVFVLVSEPVAQGFVQSLAKPGGNMTGFTNSEPMMGAKWLELLKEIAPQTSRVAVLFNPDTAGSYTELLFRSMQEMAPRLAVQASLAEVRAGTEIDPILDALAREAGPVTDKIAAWIS